MAKGYPGIALALAPAEPIVTLLQLRLRNLPIPYRILGTVPCG